MQVGDYIRTKSGYMRKIIAIYNGYVEVDDKCFNSYANVQIENDNIKKSSPNIIDLIEVGDYVNGKEISGVDEYTKQLTYEYGETTMYIDSKNIKSIVTKEQFEAIKYEIK